MKISDASTPLTFNRRLGFFLRHLIAMVYDTFLVLPVIMAAVAVATGIDVALFGQSVDSTQFATLNPQLVQVIIFASIVVFFACFWTKSGQTLGMQAWRLKLCRSDNGGCANWTQSTLRCVLAAVSVACLGAGYWFCLFDPKGRYWHDRLSGTELVLLPKAAKKKK